MRPFLSALAFLVVLTVAGCLAPPKGVTPVEGFDLGRYVGRWYEIARLDHSFERGLTDVTATYAVNPDGSVAVINRGYDEKRGEWRMAKGRARLLGKGGAASLGVSFFGPFEGGYHVIALDRENYGHAMVAGPNRDFLWILARKPALDESAKRRLVDEARRLGFPADELIWVTHGRSGDTAGTSR